MQLGQHQSFSNSESRHHKTESSFKTNNEVSKQSSHQLYYHRKSTMKTASDQASMQADHQLSPIDQSKS
jgi:hypothetical protein